MNNAYDDLPEDYNEIKGKGKINGTDGNDSIEGGKGNDTIYAGAGDDTIVDDNGYNYIYAGMGNDIIAASGFIAGEYGDDIIIAATDDSAPLGHSIPNTIYFNLGHGNDTISNNTDDLEPHTAIPCIIKFGSNIPADTNVVTFEQDSLNYNDLIIRINGEESGDSITIQNYFSGDYYLDYTIKFEDGTIWRTDSLFGIDGSNILVTKYDSDLAGSYKNDKISGTEGDDYIQSYAGNDVIIDNAGANWIDAGLGNDKITGTGTIIGGQGNDTINIQVAGKADTIFFEKGDGKDIINSLDTAEQKAVDTIILDDILETEISYQRKGNNLLLVIGDGKDQITINNYFKGAEYQTISKLILVDDLDEDNNSKIIDFTDPNFYFKFNGTAKNDNIIGSSIAGKDSIDAGIGNDKITGAGIINGGAGNDVITIKTDHSADTLLFNIGDGKDVVNSYDKSLTTDTIQFGSEVKEEDISYQRKGNNLIILVGDKGDQITINNYFKGAEYQTISQFIFTGDLDEDGNPKVADLSSPDYIFKFNGSAKNDKIIGTSFTGEGEKNNPFGNSLVGKDYIDAGDGNDNITGAGTMIGGKGNDVINIKVNGSDDTILFNIGDGKDIINSLDSSKDPEAMGYDVIQFGDDVTTNDVTWSKKGNNLILTVGNKGDQITINNYFKGDAYQTIEELKFKDGSIWELIPNGPDNTFDFIKHPPQNEASASYQAADTENQVHSLVNAMANFMPTTSAHSLIEDKPLDVNNILISANNS